MTYRVADWDAKLLTWAESVQGMPFIWGRTDCGTLARAALTLLFGRDIAPDVPFHRNEKQAIEVVRKYGGVIPVLEQLGAQKMTLPFARGGDIIAIDEPEELVTGTALAVWFDRQAVMSSRDGVIWTTAEPLLTRNPRVYSLWEIPEPGTGPLG